MSYQRHQTPALRCFSKLDGAKTRKRKINVGSGRKTATLQEKLNEYSPALEHQQFRFFFHITGCRKAVGNTVHGGSIPFTMEEASRLAANELLNHRSKEVNQPICPETIWRWCLNNITPKNDPGPLKASSCEMYGKLFHCSLRALGHRNLHTYIHEVT